MRDTTQTIQRSILRFFSGTALSRVTGVVRDIMMAAAFGATPEIAAFMMAYRFAYLLRRLLGEGALHAAFVPRFEALRKDDPAKALDFYRDVLVSAALLIVLLCSLCGFVLWNFSPAWSAGNQMIAQLTLLMLPCTLFICVFAIQNSYLQCERVYFTPAVAPALFNLTWIGAVYLLFGRTAEDAVSWLAAAIVLASVVQYLLPLWSVRCRTRKLPWRLPRPFSPSVRLLARGLAYGMLGIGASQINGALDYIFARAAHPSGPAYLWYAFRIVQAPVGLFGVAVSGALLPPLARALKAGDQGQFDHFLSFAYRRAMWLMLPCMLALFVIGGHVVAILYGRGQFSVEDFSMTNGALLAYAPGLLGTALVMVFAPAHYARGDYRTPAIVSVIAVLINITLNAVFVYGMGYGPIAVAAATSISGLFNGLALMWQCHKSGQMRYLAATLGLSACAGVLTLLSLDFLPPVLELSLSMRVLQFLFLATIFSVAYGVGQRLLRRRSLAF